MAVNLLICQPCNLRHKEKGGEVGMIQIDMPMPKNCADCCFATADLFDGIIVLFCMTPVGRKMYAPDLISRKDRPEWCPIKEMDTLEPLKEQDQPTRPIYNGRYWECEQCKERYKDILVVKEYKHCPGCGRRIEWQG